MSQIIWLSVMFIKCFGHIFRNYQSSILNNKNLIIKLLLQTFWLVLEQPIFKHKNGGEGGTHYQKIKIFPFLMRHKNLLFN